MQYTINGVAYTFCNAVASNDAIRNSFNILTEKTFGIEFEDWYRQGYWGSDYSPHNNAMICYEIFCDNDKKLIDILAVLAREETKEIIFGFPLEKTEGGTTELLQEEDTTLFLLKNKKNLFKENKLMFPLLSHA